MNDTHIVEKIFIVQGLLEKIGNETIFKKHHISSSLYGPLKMIDAGLDSISEMRKYTAETPPSLTQKIHKLENLEFVTRKIHSNDKRSWTFTITKKGLSTISQIEKESRKSNCLFGEFSKNEKEIFTKILSNIEDKLITNIHNHHEHN